MKTRLLKFILEQAEAQSVERRISIYRDLAEVIRDDHRNDLLDLAEKLESIKARSNQLLLSLIP